ncbi:response regulator [Aquimarina sp. M1]
MNIETLKILLADDDEDDRALFEKAIKELGLQTDLKLFINGMELIKYLRQPDTALPNVLFLDLNMPTMDGFECLKEIKDDPGLKGITVVIYSTSSSEKDIEATFLNGANIYVNKPTNFNDLKNILKKVLTIDWQYHTSNLNRENFLFRL